MSLQSAPAEFGYLSGEATSAYRGLWVPFEEVTRLGHDAILLGCADDRELTQENAQDLAIRHPNALPPSRAYLSTYGGWEGLVGVTLVAGTVEYGDDFIDEIGGFDGAARAVSNLHVQGGDGASLEIIPYFHSDTGKEGSERTFNTHLHTPTGCAHCANKGAISGLSHGDPLVVGVGIDNSRRILGEDRQQEDGVLRAAEMVGTYEQSLAAQAGTENFSVGRQLVVARTVEATPGRSYMIVEGSHANNAPHILGFLPRTIGSAALAHRADLPAYRTDVATVAEALTRELDISPTHIVRAILLDGAATRAALAADNDPRSIPVGILSDRPPLEVVQHIERSARKHF